MLEIIPSINCHFGDNECVAEKIREAEKFADKIHLDVADGVFTFNKSWAEPKLWKKTKTKLELEVHLMVEKPEKVVEEWLKAGAKKIIFHWETVRDDPAHVVHRDPEKLIKFIVEECKKHKAEAVIAVNPETSIEEIKPYFQTVSRFHILTVYPGIAGQKFLPLVLEKIKLLRKELAAAEISVDGGINSETGKLVKEAGADILISATHIFGSQNPKGAYEELRNI
jgi:ribulose-phosphate 3-epimerase